MVFKWKIWNPEAIPVVLSGQSSVALLVQKLRWVRLLILDHILRTSSTRMAIGAAKHCWTCFGFSSSHELNIKPKFFLQVYISYTHVLSTGAIFFVDCQFILMTFYPRTFLPKTIYPSDIFSQRHFSLVTLFPIYIFSQVTFFPCDIFS